jgi:hypothetical protein
LRDVSTQQRVVILEMVQRSRMRNPRQPRALPQRHGVGALGPH